MDSETITFEIIRSNDGTHVIKDSFYVDVFEDERSLNLTRCRISHIPNIPPLPQLDDLCLRWNLLKKIEGLNKLTSLTKLSLYDNQIEKIEGLGTLTNLRLLDLSFNRITKIEGLSTLTRLKTLYLVHNKLTEIEGLDTLSELTLLELGDNRIAKIAGLRNLRKLEKLFLGANQIRVIEDLEPLGESLKTLSLPGNALTEITGLSELHNLEELNLAQNGISQIKGLEMLEKLKWLDLNENRIECIENVGHLHSLTRFWIRANKLVSWDELTFLATLPSLQSVAFEMNENIYSNTQQYRNRVAQTLPQLKEIDGFPTKWRTGDPWQDLNDEEVDDGDGVIEEETLSSKWEESQMQDLEEEFYREKSRFEDNSFIIDFDRDVTDLEQKE